MRKTQVMQAHIGGLLGATALACPHRGCEPHDVHFRRLGTVANARA
jgi:hypothetical protein